MAGVDEVGYLLACVELCFPSLRVVDSIGNSPTRWFAECIFPLTPALSPRRGRIVRRALANPERLDSTQCGMRCSLSLREGQGEGEGGLQLSGNGRFGWVGLVSSQTLGIVRAREAKGGLGEVIRVAVGAGQRRLRRRPSVGFLPSAMTRCSRSRGISS